VVFDPALNVEQFIGKAGGATPSSDRDHTSVILPDGSARSAKLGSWEYDPPRLAPGSVILVPPRWSSRLPESAAASAARAWVSLGQAAAAQSGWDITP
jgi:hypothetical protein